MIVNSKLLFIDRGVRTLSWTQLSLSIILLLHNGGVLWYCYQLAKWYLSMSTRNMHAVEEIIIG